MLQKPFFATIPIEKAWSETGDDGAERLFVSGPMSTEMKDYDGQTIEKAGIFSGVRMYENLGGHVDCEHLFKKSVKAGKPDYSLLVGKKHAITEKDGLPWMVAELYASNPRARDIHQRVLDGCPLGFSIDGLAKAFHPTDHNRITQTEIHMVSIAAMPKNFGCRLLPGVVLKGLSDEVEAGDFSGWTEPDEPEEIEAARQVIPNSFEGLVKSLDLISRTADPADLAKAVAQIHLHFGDNPAAAPPVAEKKPAATGKPQATKTGQHVLDMESGERPLIKDTGERTARERVALAADIDFDHHRAKHEAAWKKHGGFAGGDQADFHRGVVLGMGTHLSRAEMHRGDTADIMERSHKHLEEARYLGDKGRSTHFERGYYHGAGLMHESIGKAGLQELKAAGRLGDLRVPAKVSKALTTGSGIVAEGATGGQALRVQNLRGADKARGKRKPSEPLVELGPQEESGDSKAAKRDVNYREAEAGESCGTCCYFEGTRCERVRGAVHRDDLCDLYSSRDSVRKAFLVTDPDGSSYLEA